MPVIDHYTRHSGPMTISNDLTLRYPLRRIFERLCPEAGLRATATLTAVCDPIRRKTCRVFRIDGSGSRLFPMICYYREFPALDPKLVYDMNQLDIHDGLTDVHEHRRTPAPIEDRLHPLGLKRVECSRGGTFLEARAVALHDDLHGDSPIGPGMVESAVEVRGTR